MSSCLHERSGRRPPEAHGWARGSVMRPRSRFALGALAVAVALGVVLPVGGAVGATRAVTLGPPPKKPCPHEPGMSEPRGNCLFQYDFSPYGPPGSLSFKFSPHLVRVGEQITGTVTDKRPPSTSGGWGWFVPGTWIRQPGCTGGTKAPGFGESIPTNNHGNGRCTWKVTERLPQGTYLDFDNKEKRWHGWLTSGAGDSVMGSAPDHDYFFILDKDESVIEGHVTTRSGAGVRGVKVFIGGDGADVYAATDRDGYYNAIVGEGTFTVRPRSGKDKFQPARKTVHVTRTTKTVDFATGGSILIKGTVKDHRGLPLAGVRVVAIPVAGGDPKRALTDVTGTYRMQVAPGAWVVTPKPSGRTDRERYVPVSKRLEQDTGTAAADFTLAAADELDLRTDATQVFMGVDWTLLKAGGGWFEYGSLVLRNGRDDPVPGQTLHVDSPAWDVPPAGDPAPHVLVCDDVWRRLFPGGTFERVTDADGRVDYAVWFGAEPGNWLLHARDTAQPTSVLDVLRVGQTGGIVGPDSDVIVNAVRGAEGIGLLPLTGPTLAKTQESILDYLLQWRTSSFGPGGQAATGDFAPIRNAAGAQGAIVFFPAGNPYPLRAHLATGAALPPGYTTHVLAIKRFVILGSESWVVQISSGPQGLMSIPDWEQQFGAARPGYAAARAGEDLAWLGAPYPPPSTDVDARLAFNRCAPGAAPAVNWVQTHSPVRLLITDAKGHRLGYDASGKAVKGLSGYVVPGKGSRPTTYVVPSEPLTVAITGTGRGRATIVAGGASGTVRAFTVSTRRGAHGTLRLAGAGAARSLRFAGRTVRASNGIGIRLRGLPRRLRAGRATTLRLRLTDQFGRPLPGALVSVRARGTAVSGLADTRGRVVLAFTPRRRGAVRVRASAPGHVTLTRTLRAAGR